MSNPKHDPFSDALSGLNTTAQLDQTIAAIVVLIAALHAFFMEARASGFTEAQAFQLTRDFQRRLLYGQQEESE